MAFSLGNLIKASANTALKAVSPIYNAISTIGQVGKNAYNALTTPSATPTQTPFSVSGNTANGAIPNSASTSPSLTPSFNVPQSSSVLLKTSQAPNALSVSPAGMVQPPLLPNTISSDTLNSGGNAISTVPPPVVPPPPSTTPVTTTSSAPGPTVASPTITPPGTSISSDLTTATSDAPILDTQKAITDVSTQIQGKGQALQDAQTAAGVPRYQQQLNDITAQMTSLNNDSTAAQIAIQGKPVDSVIQSRQINAVERARVVKTLGLSSVAAALQGNIALATDQAQKAVDAKFAPLEAELSTLKQQLDFNKDNFTRAESTRAQALSIALQDKAQALSDAKDKQTQINNVAIEAAKNGADAQTLNAILNTSDLSTALGVARGAMAKSTGIGVYNLSEAQANIAEKLADDFEKAAGSFSAVRDAYGKIQAAQQGTGISDTALIFAYMKLLDPTSVVREGEQASVQQAGNVPTSILNTYNQLVDPNGPKLGALADAKSLRKQILDTSGSLFAQAQKTQDQIVQQYNGRATAYGIPTDLVTRDLSAGTTAVKSMIGAVPSDTVYARIKALSPNATEDQLQAALAKFKSDPSQLSQLGFSADPGTSVNSPVSSNVQTGTGARTDRHNNPTAFTTDIAKAAGLQLGVDYTVGDQFPNNPSLKTAKLLGDPVATTINVIDKLGFQTSSGKPRWDYINIPKATWDGYSYNQKKQVIAQMYAHEGGSALKSALV